MTSDLPWLFPTKKHTAWPKIKSAKRAKSVAAAKSTFKPDGLNGYLVSLTARTLYLPETNTKCT